MPWRLLLGVIVLFGFGLAAADEVDQARQFYERGMAHYQLGEYDGAITAWQEGFRLKPAPEFLYNLGQAYRLSNRSEKAVQSYKAFLRMVPDSPNGDEVREYIVSMQRQERRREQTGSKSSPAPAVTDPVSGTTSTLHASPAHERSVAKKGWFWGAIVGGSVVIAGAVTLGVVLSKRDSTRMLPDLNY